MIKRIKIWWHKSFAKVNASAYYSVLSEYDCSPSVVDHISPRASKYRLRTNYHLDALRDLGEPVPAGRF